VNDAANTFGIAVIAVAVVAVVVVIISSRKPELKRLHDAAFWLELAVIGLVLGLFAVIFLYGWFAGIGD
jgi:uncharacterized membrane protein